MESGLELNLHFDISNPGNLAAADLKVSSSLSVTVRTVTLTSQSSYENGFIEYKLNVETGTWQGFDKWKLFFMGVTVVLICIPTLLVRGHSFSYVGSYFINNIIFIVLFWKFQTRSSIAQRQSEACKFLLSFPEADETDLPLQGFGGKSSPEIRPKPCAASHTTQFCSPPHLSAPGFPPKQGFTCSNSISSSGSVYHHLCKTTLTL